MIAIATTANGAARFGQMMKQMTKILEWLKAILVKLPKLLPHRRGTREETEPALGLIPLDKKLTKKEERAAKMGRPVDTRQGGSNMPRYQPYPLGHGWKKRTRKTMGGAYYGCSKCCDEFFVRVPVL